MPTGRTVARGEFKLGYGRYCYPLIVTDHASCFPLLCEAPESSREDTAVTAFERLFREPGLRLAICSDKGGLRRSPSISESSHREASVLMLRLSITF